MSSMNMIGNTILITGGGSGIGRGLAESFHALGNQVIIAGRREQQLQETIAANAGMQFLILDQGSPESIRGFAGKVVEQYPQLNVLVNNAGIQRMESLRAGTVDDGELTVTTNLLGPMRLTAALLPTLIAQPKAAIVNVTSALAFLPQVLVPTYCATKAAMHSYTQSLRFQLRDSSVQVIEIVPPMVQTGLQGSRGNSPHAMPLAEFIAETMGLLKDSAQALEIVVARAKLLRFAESRGDFDATFTNLNNGVVAAMIKGADDFPP
jgi:uncharacterized oxidoreductase